MEHEDVHMKRGPTYVVAAVASGLVVARMIWPDIQFDATSLALFGIAALALLLPNLPPLKKLKLGSFEAEFEKAIRAFEQKVLATETESQPAPARVVESGADKATWEKFFDDYFSIVNSGASNFEKILSAAILIEKMVAAAAIDVHASRRRSPAQQVSALAEHGLITQDEEAAFREFWNLRSKVVHGELGQPTDAQTARVLDLAWRLVRTFA